MSSLRAPFPWFGGKSSIASEVWARFGRVDNYVEPFFGSGAVLLARPDPGGVETVNDADGFLVNFWRSVSTDPDEVAYYADWPVSEADLHARHAYLVQRIPSLAERLQGDPDYHEPKLAGWWVWGACSWIGSGWCSGEGPWVTSGGQLVRRDDLVHPGAGIGRQLPHLGDPGQGINRKLPHLGDLGRGINRQLSQTGGGAGGGSITKQGEAIRQWFRDLNHRLRRVRICCGDWSRVVTPVVTSRHGMTGVFLDPPYDTGDIDYAAGGGGIFAEVAAWASGAGEDPRLRIALCGHEGDYDLPGWEAMPWKARGGYGNQGGEDADDNRHREMIWFSPSCESAPQGVLFDVAQPEKGAACET